MALVLGVTGFLLAVVGIFIAGEALRRVGDQSPGAQTLTQDRTLRSILDRLNQLEAQVTALKETEAQQKAAALPSPEELVALKKDLGGDPGRFVPSDQGKNLRRTG